MSLFTFSARDMNKTANVFSNTGNTPMHSVTWRQVLTRSRKDTTITLFIHTLYALVFAAAFIVPALVSRGSDIVRAIVFCIGLIVALLMLRNSVRIVNYMCGIGYTQKDDADVLDQIMSDYKKKVHTK